MTDLITAGELASAWPGAAKLSADAQGSLVAATSALVSSECDRVLGQADHDEIHFPGRTRKLYLKQSPVTAVARIACDLTTALSVKYAGPAGRAQARLTATGLAPSVTLTGLAVSDTSAGSLADRGAVLFAEAPTLGAVAESVALAAGWSATVGPGLGAFLASDLNPDLGARGAKDFPAAFLAFGRDLDYGMSPEGAAVGEVDLLESFPNGYRYPDRMGHHLFSTDPRLGGVRVVYTAGYATADVPADLKRLCIGAAHYLAAQVSRDGGLQSETVGKYSWTAALSNGLKLPDWICRGLDKYRRVEIV